MNLKNISKLRILNSKILNGYIFTIAAIPSILITFLIEQSRNPNKLAMNLLLISTLSYAAFLLMLFIYYLVFLKPKIDSGSTLLSIACAGFLIGTGKGLTTFYLFELSRSDPLQENSLLQRLFSGGAIGLVTLLGIAIAVHEFDRLKKLREERIKWLIDSNVLAAKESQLFEQLAESVRNKFSSEFALKILPLVSDVEFSAQKTSQIDQVLKGLEQINRSQLSQVADQIKNSYESRYPEISPKELFKAIFGHKLFLISVIVPILVLTSISFVYSSNPIDQLLVRLAVIGLSSSLIFWLANKVRKLIKGQGIVLWVIAVIASGITPFLVNKFLFQDNLLLMIPAMFSLIAWTGTVSIFTNLGFNFFKNRQNLEIDLGAELDQSLIKEETLRNLNRDLLFEISKFLHGTIQTKVMTTGISLTNAIQTQDFARLTRVTNELREFAQDPLRDFTFKLTDDVAQETETLIQKWNGLLKINFNSDDLNLLAKFQQSNFLKVLEEASLNSYRHSKADHLQVTVNKLDEQVVVKFIDNGVGIITNKRGFGSLLFDDVAKSWKLTSNLEGTGTTLSMIMR